MDNTNSRTRILVESAILVAMAYLLSFIKVWNMPMGGSITLVSMFPILLIGLRRGPVWGLTAGCVYAILNFIQQPYFIHPFQFLLDYIFAFMSLGLAGFFKGRKSGFQIGATVGILGRLACSFASGVIYYGMYAADYGFANAYAYSFAYNAAYLIPELILTLVVGTILIKIPRLKLLG